MAQCSCATRLVGPSLNVLFNLLLRKRRKRKGDVRVRAGPWAAYVRVRTGFWVA